MPNRRQRIERRAAWRCEYCRAPQRICGYRFHIEHIMPLAAGGADDDANLALACGPCNLTKTVRTRFIDTVTGDSAILFHPRMHRWVDHFRWSVDGVTIEGRTPIGRATIGALKMNSVMRLEARAYWNNLGMLR